MRLVRSLFETKIISWKFMNKREINAMKKSKNESNESNANKKQKKALTSEEACAAIACDDLQDIQLNYDTHRLRSAFFDKQCLELSKAVLNKYLVRKIEIERGKFALAIGKVVETEAYVGGDDKASHTYNNKQTDRMKAMYMSPGRLRGHVNGYKRTHSVTDAL